METIDKLPGIWGDLVRSDSDWETWNLDQLAEAVLGYGETQSITVRMMIKRRDVENERECNSPIELTNLEGASTATVVSTKLSNALKLLL